MYKKEIGYIILLHEVIYNLIYEVIVNENLINT